MERERKKKVREREGLKVHPVTLYFSQLPTHSGFKSKVESDGEKEKKKKNCQSQ